MLLKWGQLKPEIGGKFMSKRNRLFKEPLTDQEREQIRFLVRTLVSFLIAVIVFSLVVGAIVSVL